MRCVVASVAALALWLGLPARGDSQADAATPDGGATAPLATVEVPPAKRVVTLRPVVVTAARRDQQIFESPRAITSVEREETGHRAPPTLPDLLGSEPGVFLQKTNVGAGAPIIRGLVGPSNLLLVDGVRVNNATWRTGPNQYLALFDPYAVARVEILRGPASVLYGSDAVGGVIQIVTPNPRLSVPGDFDVGGRALGRVASAEGSAAGRIGLDLNALGVGLVAGATTQGAGDLRAGKGVVQPQSGLDDGFGDVKAAGRLGPGTLTGMYQRARTYGANRTDAAPVGTLTRYDNARDLAYLTYETRLPVLDYARATLSFHRQLEDRDIRTFAGAVDPAREAEASLLRETREEDSTHTWGGALLVRTALLSGDLSLSYGADFYRDFVYSSAEVRRGGMVGFVPRDRGAFSDHSRYTNGGLYLLGEWRAIKAESASVTVFAGGRGSDVRAFAGNVPQPSGSQDVSYSSDTFAFCAGASAKLGNSGFVSASVNQGIRAPNLQETTVLGDTGSTFEIPNPALAPERVTAFEVVLRYAVPRASLDIAAYYSDLTDTIVRGDATWKDADGTERDLVDGKRVVQRVNGGRGRILGVEATARVVLAPRLEAWGHFTYTFGEQERGGAVTPSTRIPPPFGSLAIRGHVRRERPTLSVDLALRGAFDQRRVSPEDAKDLRIGPNGTPGWIALDARLVSEVTEKIRFSASVENLFDRLYKLHGSGVYAPGFNAVGLVDLCF